MLRTRRLLRIYGASLILGGNSCNQDLCMERDILRSGARMVNINKFFVVAPCMLVVQCVPLATEPSISLIILPLMRILQRNLRRTTDTFLFISYTTNVLLFQIRCNIFIVVRIIKEMPGSVASGTHCIYIASSFDWMNRTEYCERDSIGNV